MIRRESILCFVDMEKAFDRVPRKKELPEIIVTAVMSQYEGAKMRVRVESGISEEFPVEAGVH